MGEQEAMSAAREHLIAASRKVAITRYHVDRLQEALVEWPADLDALQAHFEGVFYAGVAATEKIVAALYLLFDGLTGQEPDTDIGRVIRRLKDDAERYELGRALERWRYGRIGDKTFFEEARDIRNAATHEFSEKRHAPPGQWFYSVRNRDDRAGQWRSGRIDEFPAAYADHIAWLEPLIREIAEAWRIELELETAAP